MLSRYAQQMMEEHFQNAFYIGRYSVDPSPDRRPYKFFYVGHDDVFGVAMSARKKLYDFQLWPKKWCLGRTKKLDKAFGEALKGKFIDCRHNALVKRAKGYGKFIPATEASSKEVSSEKVTKEKLPIRGKRKRRKLHI